MEARFHLPGLRNNFPLNMILIDMLKRYPKYFREGIVIASCFGEFPASLWNGGRFNANDQCDGKYVASVIKALNAKGVAVGQSLLAGQDIQLLFRKAGIQGGCGTDPSYQSVGE